MTAAAAPAPGGAGTFVLDVQAVYAGFWRRAWALVLDFTFDSLALAIIFSATDDAFSWPLLVAFLLINHVGLAAEGGSIGKRVLGLRIVRVDGSRVGVGRAALRELVRCTGSVWSLGLGFLWMLDDRQRQTWHDLAGGTIVVRELRGEPGPAWRFNPPWLLPAIDPDEIPVEARMAANPWAALTPIAVTPAEEPVAEDADEAPDEPAVEPADEPGATESDEAD